MSNKQKHLEFVQDVINRMARNSFLLKAWTVTIISALFVLSSKELISEYALFGYIPIITFWILDGFFLSQERSYRSLYDDIRIKHEEQIDFSMNNEEYLKKERNTWCSSMFSTTLLLFYLSLSGGMLLIFLFHKGYLNYG